MIALILCSPPYAQQAKGTREYTRAANMAKTGQLHAQRPDVYISPTNLAAQGLFTGYSMNQDNIGNLPYE